MESNNNNNKAFKMTPNNKHKDRIINLLESFAELAGQDIEEAKEVLRTAGKDYHKLVEKGLEKLKKIQLKYNQNSESFQINSTFGAENGTSNYVLLFNSQDTSVSIGSYNNQPAILKAADVFNTFIRKNPLFDIPYNSLNIQEQIKEIKFLRIVRQLFFIIKINAENAIVQPVLNGLDNNILLSLSEVDVLLKTGYFILSDSETNKKTWMPIEQEAVLFVANFMKDLNPDGSLSLKKGLEYFSKRNEIRWIKFEPEELDLEKNI